MKHLAIFSLAMIMSLSAFTQNIKVNSKGNRVKGTMMAGYSLDIDGKEDEVDNILTQYLKQYGKSRLTFDYVAINSPTLGGSVHEGKVLYGTVTGDDKKAQVWVGIDTAEWKNSSGAALNKIEKLVYQFGVQYYQGLVQKEINESQQALDATEKQKLRLVNENKNLTTKLANNEQDKIKLEKQLELNKLDHAVLLQKIENNKKAQDSVVNAGLQIKKVMDAKKEKQKKIN
jgi:hypothetical protein